MLELVEHLQYQGGTTNHHVWLVVEADVNCTIHWCSGLRAGSRKLFGVWFAYHYPGVNIQKDVENPGGFGGNPSFTNGGVSTPFCMFTGGYPVMLNCLYILEKHTSARSNWSNAGLHNGEISRHCLAHCKTLTLLTKPGWGIRCPHFAVPLM